ncbi:MAG: glycosyltransferase [Lachnospiraceae bacterium]
MRIFQVVSTLSYGDGVGNDVLAIDKILKDAGYETAIYAKYIGKKVPKGAVFRISHMPQLNKNDIVLYHLAISCTLNVEIQKWDCKILIRYHNVTPAGFFSPYSLQIYRDCTTGIEQVKTLKDLPKYVLADSGFNKSDLESYGYTCPIDVVPILIPFDDYNTSPNKELVEKYTDVWTNIIFVGRIAPNKKQEDIIKAFTYYKKYINPMSRLIFVGSFDINDLYYQELVAYIKRLEVEDVIFTGHIKFDEILAYYHLADIFLCMSEHEGFCIPLVEAMHFQVPIIAYDSTAIPFTMQGQGAIVDTKDPIFIAKLIDVIIKNKSVREELIAVQNNIKKCYEYETVKNVFLGFLKDFIEES